MTCSKKSGTCESCQSACERKPGWFKVGEAEKVAEYLGLTLPELFKSKLAVDWWEGDGYDDGNIFVLSPALIDEPSGQEFPGNPEGQCVFYVEGKCAIHPVKPYECRESVPCGHDRTRNYHEEAAMDWNTPENHAQIVELLGREPESSEFNGGSIFDLFRF